MYSVQFYGCNQQERVLLFLVMEGLSLLSTALALLMMLMRDSSHWLLAKRRYNFQEPGWNIFHSRCCVLQTIDNLELSHSDTGLDTLLLLTVLLMHGVM